MRLLSVVVLVCLVACARASVESDLDQRILARAAETPADSPYVFAEIVESLNNPVPVPSFMEVAASAEELAQQQAMYFPGYPMAQPGFYGAYGYAPAAAQANYLANMRYAAAPGSSSVSSASASASQSAGFPLPGAYGQYGFPYSAYPPVPPPMPTYLPPPPYIPLATPTAGGGGSQAAF